MLILPVESAVEDDDFFGDSGAQQKILPRAVRSLAYLDWMNLRGP